MKHFLEELKRRNMYRLLAGYVVAAWLILQVAAIVVPAFALPDWMMPGLIIILVLALPLVFALGWIYELTPEGLRRTTSAGEVEASPYDRRIDLGIILALLVTVLLLLGDRFLFTSDRTELDDGMPSIAVLAFESMSSNPEDAYFSDGISEEILNLLAHIEGLRVSARTSSFQFRGEDRDIREIGNLLDVKTVLEGSVRRSGNKLRVTAQLIDASNGYHLWSDTFDSEVEDVFEVQDRIAGKIAGTLQVKLLAREGPGTRAHEPSVENYQKYLLARHLMWQRTAADFEKAQVLLEEIISNDPSYAQAIAALAETIMFRRIPFYGGIAREAATARARELIERALTLNPEIAEGHHAKGLMYFQARDLDNALAAFSESIRLMPSNAEAHYLRSFTYAAKMQVVKAFADLEEAGRQNPLSWKIASILSAQYLERRDFEKANASLDKVQMLQQGDSYSVHGVRAAINFYSGKWAESYRQGQLTPSAHTYDFFGTTSKILPKAILGETNGVYGDDEEFVDEEVRLIALQELAGGLKDFERAQSDYEAAPAEFRNDHNNKMRFIRAAYEASARDVYLTRAKEFEVEKNRIEYGREFLNVIVITALALTCEEAGNPTCKEAVRDQMEMSISNMKQSGTILALASFEACLAVLEGSPDDVVKWLKIAVTERTLTTFELESRVFEVVWEKPEYKAMRRDLYEHMNAERAKLGLAPVEMTALSN